MNKWTVEVGGGTFKITVFSRRRKNKNRQQSFLHLNEILMSVLTEKNIPNGLRFFTIAVRSPGKKIRVC